MIDIDEDFCFPCLTCHTKFYSLREHRKHPCEMLYGNPANSSVQTTNKDKQIIRPQTYNSFKKESNIKEDNSQYNILPKKKSDIIDSFSCTDISIKKESYYINYNISSKSLPKQQTDPSNGLLCTYQDCSKAFATPKLLYSHKHRVHGIQRRFNCDNCTYSSKEKKNVRRHKDFKHSDLKLVTCTECGESFKCTASLAYHMKKKYGEYCEQ